MNRTGIITLIILGSVLVIASLYYWQVQRQQSQIALDTSQAAAAFSGSGEYTDIDGNPVSLSQYVGKIVIAFAWASWCPECVDQLRVLGSINSEFDDVIVLAFNRAEPKSTASSFLEFYNLESQVQLVLDPRDRFFESVSGYSMPETVIFDAAGQIVYHERGQITADNVREILKQVR